jgi:hypothetical protein
MAGEKDTFTRDLLYAALILAAVIVGLFTLWLFAIDGGSTGID